MIIRPMLGTSYFRVYMDVQIVRVCTNVKYQLVAYKDLYSISRRKEKSMDKRNGDVEDSW